MSDVAQQMLAKKKARSPFVQLKDDGETIEGLVMELKQISKQGYAGEDVEVLRMVLQCDIPEVGLINKNFDNGSMKWLNEVTEKEIEKGDNIRITRHGEYKSNKTYYEATLLMKQGQKVEEKPEDENKDDNPPPAEEPPAPEEQ